MTRRHQEALDDARGYLQEAVDALQCAGMSAVAAEVAKGITACDAEERLIRDVEPAAVVDALVERFLDASFHWKGEEA